MSNLQLQDFVRVGRKIIGAAANYKLIVLIINANNLTELILFQITVRNSKKTDTSLSRHIFKTKHVLHHRKSTNFSGNLILLLFIKC